MRLRRLGRIDKQRQRGNADSLKGFFEMKIITSIAGILLEIMLVVAVFLLNVYYSPDILKNGCFTDCTSIEDSSSADMADNDPVNQPSKEVEHPQETVELMSICKDDIDESVRPTGGKVISIPAVPVDMLYEKRDDDDRFVGVSKKELARLARRNAAENGVEIDP